MAHRKKVGDPRKKSMRKVCEAIFALTDMSQKE